MLASSSSQHGDSAPLCLLSKLLTFAGPQFLPLINGIIALLKDPHKGEMELNEMVYVMAPGSSTH